MTLIAVDEPRHKTLFLEDDIICRNYVRLRWYTFEDRDLKSPHASNIPHIQCFLQMEW